MLQAHKVVQFTIRIDQAFAQKEPVTIIKAYLYASPFDTSEIYSETVNPAPPLVIIPL